MGEYPCWKVTSAGTAGFVEIPGKGPTALMVGWWGTDNDLYGRF
jgi:hypothetical protein